MVVCACVPRWRNSLPLATHKDFAFARSVRSPTYDAFQPRVVAKKRGQPSLSARTANRAVTFLHLCIRTAAHGRRQTHLQEPAAEAAAGLSQKNDPDSSTIPGTPAPLCLHTCGDVLWDSGFSVFPRRSRGIGHVCSSFITAGRERLPKAAAISGRCCTLRVRVV